MNMDTYTINHFVNIWRHFLIHLLSTLHFLSVLRIDVCWVMWAPRNVITTANDPMSNRAIRNENVNHICFFFFCMLLIQVYLYSSVSAMSKNVFHLELKEFYYNFKHLHLFKEVYKVTFSSTSSLSSLLLGVAKVLLVSRSFAW